MSMPGNKGFTLVELLIVISIIGILAAISIPAWTDYSTRPQIAEGLHISDPIRKKIEDFYAFTGRFPRNNRECRLPAPEQFGTRYVKSISVDNGAIQITYGNSAAHTIEGRVLSLRPAVRPHRPGGTVLWLCGYASHEGREPSGQNLTDLDNKFLSGDCRKGKPRGRQS